MASKKKSRKMRKKVVKNRNIVLFVEDSVMKAKVFADAKSATKFVENFKKNYEDPESGYWVDLLVTDIRGDIKSLYDMEICVQT